MRPHPLQRSVRPRVVAARSAVEIHTASLTHGLQRAALSLVPLPFPCKVGWSCSLAQRPRRAADGGGGSTGGFPLWRRGRGHEHPLQGLPELPPPRPRAEKSKERSSSGAAWSLLIWASGSRLSSLLYPQSQLLILIAFFSFSLDGDV